jgi:O-methyltransferase
LLRQKAARALKGLYRLTQKLSTHAVDSHVERYVIDDFIRRDHGAAHGVTGRARADLVRRMRVVTDHVQSATRLLYHVVLAREILDLPPDSEGVVVECGAYKGASSASLSLACSLTGRKLWVCDSFSGLPDGEADTTRDYPHLRLQGRYTKGMYAGPLDEVRENVTRYGAPGCCEFLPGLFAESLARLPSKVAFAFVDVDLTSSMQDCIRQLWPRLADEAAIYTDDSCDMEVVRVWFDEAWWQRELGERAPGYVGSGCGLPLAVGGASLGYCRKVGDLRKSYEQSSWLADS